MANKNNKKEGIKLSFDGAAGVNTQKSHGMSPCAVDITNFRILPDGSLKKRDGYKKILTTDQSIRAIWSGYIANEFLCFILAEQNVYAVDLTDGYFTDYGEIETQYDPAKFFYMRDALYLIDGYYIYKIEYQNITIQEGYVPLLGKDWHTGYPGEIHEPLNILNPHARITYLAEENCSQYLSTMYTAGSIDAVYKNGVLLSSSSYSYNSDENLISVRNISPGDRLEVNVTFMEYDTSERQSLLSCHDAHVFGGINSSRLFLWNGYEQNTVFPSSYVSNKALEASKNRYPDSNHLYFRSGDQFVVGDGKYSVMAMARHYDRLLIFTQGDTWMADTSACGTEEFPVMNINSAVGCASFGGATVAGNLPMCINPHGIFAWTSDTDELNECNAYSISKPIDQLIQQGFLHSAVAFYDRKHREVWFHEPDGDEIVWVYNLDHRAWTKFSGINAYYFFEDQNGNVGFVDEYSVYIFSDENTQDIADTSRNNIIASIDSGIYDFYEPQYKKIHAVTCRADRNSTSSSFTISTDRGETINLSFGNQGYVTVGDHKIIRRAARSHRLKSFSFEFIDRGRDSQILHGFEIEVR